MPTVTVLKFPAADGANNALATIQEIHRQRLIELHDAAIIRWPVGKKIPQIKQLHNLAGSGAVSGMFWGTLLGFIFFMPLFGMTLGAALGAMEGALREHGIDDNFINRVRSQVKEGTSTLFLITSDAVLERVSQAMKHLTFEIIETSLSKEQEQELREALGVDPSSRSVVD